MTLDSKVRSLVLPAAVLAALAGVTLMLDLFTQSHDSGLSHHDADVRAANRGGIGPSANAAEAPPFNSTRAMMSSADSRDMPPSDESIDRKYYLLGAGTELEPASSAEREERERQAAQQFRFSAYQRVVVILLDQILGENAKASEISQMVTAFGDTAGDFDAKKAALNQALSNVLSPEDFEEIMSRVEDSPADDSSVDDSPVEVEEADDQARSRELLFYSKALDLSDDQGDLFTRNQLVAAQVFKNYIKEHPASTGSEDETAVFQAAAKAADEYFNAHLKEVLSDDQMNRYIELEQYR